MMTLDERIPKELQVRLQQYANASGVDLAHMLEHLLDQHEADPVDLEEWQVKEVEEAVVQADPGNFATAAEVDSVFAKYDAD